MELNFSNLETYQWMELKDYKGKLGSFDQLPCSLSYLWSLKCEKSVCFFLFFFAFSAAKSLSVWEIYLSTQRRN